MGRHLPGRLPNALGRVELRRVWRQAVDLDFVGIRRQPTLASFVEPVARSVVDDQEDLARAVRVHQSLQELVEGVAVEDFRELVSGVRLIEADGAEHVSRLPLPKGVYPRLDADFGPGLVEGPVEPEAGLVLEDDDAAGLGRFFLSRAAAPAATWPALPRPLAQDAYAAFGPKSRADEEGGGCGGCGSSRRNAPISTHRSSGQSTSHW